MDIPDGLQFKLVRPTDGPNFVTDKGCVSLTGFAYADGGKTQPVSDEIGAAMRRGFLHLPELLRVIEVMERESNPSDPALGIPGFVSVPRPMWDALIAVATSMCTVPPPAPKPTPPPPPPKKWTISEFFAAVRVECDTRYPGTVVKTQGVGWEKRIQFEKGASDALAARTNGGTKFDLADLPNRDARLGWSLAWAWMEKAGPHGPKVRNKN